MSMMRNTSDGERIFSMETLGKYRPKSLWDFLKLNERKACENAFDAFVNLVLGQYCVCSLTHSSLGRLVLHEWNAHQQCTLAHYTYLSASTSTHLSISNMQFPLCLPSSSKHTRALCLPQQSHPFLSASSILPFRAP